MGDAATADATGSDSRSYPSRPFVGVGVVVWHGRRVLLIRRGKAPREGQWSLPGGAQHLGETVAEAARREVREEAGIDIRVIGLLDVIDLIDRDEADRVRHHYTLVDLVAEALSDDITAGDDAAAAIWADPDDLGPYALWEETSRLIALSAERMGRAP